MRLYKNIKLVESEAKPESTVILRRRSLHIWGLMLVVCLSFSCLGISILGLTGLRQEVANITASWSPNITDLGKIKFVDKDLTEEAMVMVEDFCLPFNYSYVESAGEGEYMVSGLGSMVVKCCGEGVVENIEMNGDKRTVTVLHKDGVRSVYSLIDTLGVKKGDKTQKNTPIGISNDSQIGFKITYHNKVISSLVIKNGEFAFE